MHILTEIERYLRRTEMAPTRFGRAVAGDPRLVFDLRRGRQPGSSLSGRIVAFIRADAGEVR